MNLLLLFICCRMMVSIIVFLLFMMGLFGLKENTVIPLLIIPLVVICIIFWYHVNQVFAKQSAKITFTTCTKIRDLAPDLIQVNSIHSVLFHVRFKLHLPLKRKKYFFGVTLYTNIQSRRACFFF